MNVKNKELIKNSVILIVGKFCTQFITFLLLPLYTLKLSTSEYGIVDLITTYVALLVPVITLQLEMAIFRFLIDSRNDLEKKKEYVTNSYIFLTLLTIIFSVLYYIVFQFINYEYSIEIYFMILVTIYSNILLQTSRGMGENISYSIACIISGISTLILNLVFLLGLDLGIRSVLISVIISNLMCALFLSIKLKLFRYIQLDKLNKKTCADLVKYSFPLVPNGLIWWIINTSDRTIITFLLGSAENGLYSVSNKFSNIINSLYSIFNMSWTESISLHIDENDTFISDTFNRILVFIFSIVILLINSMFIIFPILISENYIEAYDYIPILIVSSIFSMLSANLSAVYIAKKRTKEIAKTTILSGVLNVIINLMFIKRIKLYAAAISTLISFFIVFLIRYNGTKKMIYFKLDTKAFFIFSIIIIISMYIYNINNIILNIIMLMISIVIVVYYNKDIMKKILSKLKR